MTYFLKNEKYFDKNGVSIEFGDLLHKDPPEANNECDYFIVYDAGTFIEVRDLGNNNVEMCELGSNGDVINIGNYKKHPRIFKYDDINYYFGSSEYSYDAVNYCLSLSSDLDGEETTRGRLGEVIRQAFIEGALCAEKRSEEG
jgi:hypothetical protein